MCLWQTKEHYRVLAPFATSYKKRYLEVDKRQFLWTSGNKDKTVRFLVRMVVQSGASWKEYKLTKDGQFGPSCVFRVVSMCDIESVVGTLNQSDLFE